MISVHSLDHIITVHVYGFICNKFRILLYYIYINLYHFIRCKYHILLSLTSTYLSSLKLVVIVSSLISYDNSCDRKSTETDRVVTQWFVLRFKKWFGSSHSNKRNKGLTICRSINFLQYKVFNNVSRFCCVC